MSVKRSTSSESGRAVKKTSSVARSSPTVAGTTVGGSSNFTDATVVGSSRAVQAALESLEQIRDALVKDTLEGFTQAQDALEHADEELKTLGLHDEAGAAFVEVVHRLLGDRPLSVTAARRAALVAAAATVWEDTVGPLLSGHQARELLGDVSRQRLEQLTKSGRLMVLEDRSGGKHFPAWQFGEDGRPLEALVAAHRTLVTEGQMSAWSAASWCVHEHPELDGRSPLEWARAGEDPQRLALVAGRDAARSAR